MKKIEWKYLSDRQKIGLIRELQTMGFLLKEVAQIIGVTEVPIRRICQIYGIEWKIGAQLGNTNAAIDGLGRNTIMRQAQKAVVQSGRSLRVCESCGVNEPFQNHHVHHIDEDRSNNIAINLKVLCNSCHTQEHKKERNDLGQFS